MVLLAGVLTLEGGLWKAIIVFLNVCLLQAQRGGIDHFVLFKVKEGTSQESIEAMLQSFRDLAASMDPSILFQLTAGDHPSQPTNYCSLYPNQAMIQKRRELWLQ